MCMSDPSTNIIAGGLGLQRLDSFFRETTMSPFGRALFGGGVAGCVAKTATAPLARLTVLAQTSSLLTEASSSTVHGGSSRRVFMDCGVLTGIGQIVRREGILGLWKGNTCVCLHRFLFTGMNFAMFEYCSSPLGLGDSTFGRLLSGALATSIATTVCYPLDLVRVRLMIAMENNIQRRGILRTLKTINSKEGFKGLFRGLGPSLLAHVPPTAISFCAYEPMKKYLISFGLSERCNVATIFAGGSAGLLGSVIMFPIDLVRRRVQAMEPDTSMVRRSFLQEFVHVYKNEGVRGFCRGLTPEMMRVFPYVAILFFGYESMRPSRHEV